MTPNLKHPRPNQLKIEIGKLSELDILFQMYQNAKNALDRMGVHQWTDNYPSIVIIENDLKREVLYTLKNDIEIIGAISISTEQEEEYQAISWESDITKALVIHRLVIEPKHQRRGHARRIIDFAENFALNNGYSSIILDVYSKNHRAIDFYKKRDYVIRGEVSFPMREYLFYCMEKEIKTI